MGPENDGVEHELLEIVRDVRALALTERMRGVAAVCSNQDGMKDKPADQVAAEDSADSHTPGVEEAAVDSTSAEEKVEHERRASHS